MRNCIILNLPKMIRKTSTVSLTTIHQSVPHSSNLFSINCKRGFPNRRIQLLPEREHVGSQFRLFSVSSVLEKAKDKGDKKKGGKAQHINLNEVAEFLDADKYTAEMERSIEDLKNSFIKNLTLRSSVGSIEQIVVNFEGEEFMLQELVQIARKPKMVVLKVTTFPQALPQIIEALENSGMNLSPQQDGTTLFIPIPKVTKEHREGLAKNAKALYIRCRDNIKDIRNKELKNLKKKPSISEDQVRRIQAQLDAICEKYIKDAELILDTKQKDLLRSSD